ncbi:hypothetical protein GCM10020367_62310 [Streptomyces sannanensis]|uniref:Uncharacterized protein n=1 Tax=Streptomyces sannanensis TaxID=285536 RepID=A0ABP6SLH1_9ACTN
MDRSCIVVDTGPWIFGRQVLLPAGVVSRIDSESRTVYVNCTKDEVKAAPGHRGGQHDSDVASIRLAEQYYANRHM